MKTIQFKIDIPMPLVICALSCDTNLITMMSGIYLIETEAGS